MNTKDIDEKLLQAPSGYLYLFLGILLMLACLPAYIIPAVLGASAGVSRLLCHSGHRPADGRALFFYADFT